ncbi:VWA domain-containing protein [Candidatus Ozemobacteraceae bacterium]|nr:VWA domain-containing protein [Candidatus Ozemobacteraceae bacterium]
MPTQAQDNDRGVIGRNGETVPLIGCRLSGHLHGRVGEWKLEQRFRNVEQKPIEATYLFPLPEEAAVCGFSIRIGERVLTGVVEEREKAFEKYDEAMAEGDGAFLLDQERPNVFHLSVGNLLPNQEVLIEFRFIQVASPEPRGVRVMIPTTISPRYAPRHLSPEALAEIERTTPPYAAAVPYGISLELDAVMASPIKVVESPSHPLRTEIDGNTAHISFGQQTTALDRDLVILVETAQAMAMSALAAEYNGLEHLLIEFVPEKQAVSAQERKTVVFLVDCSGSMDGDSIAQARQAVELCLRALQPGDRFQIVRFGSDCRPMTKEPVVFTQASLEAAVEQVRQIEADLGGTEILGSLTKIETMTGNGAFTLLVMTDGQVSNEDEVLAWAGRMRNRCRAFTFGIGAGASEHLVRGLARRGGGAAEFIFPGERIEPKVLRQFARVAAPVVTDLAVDWGVSGAEPAPREIPAVFAGESLLVAARFKKGQAPAEGAKVTVRGKTKAGDLVWSAEIRRANPGEGGAAALWWARQAILELGETHDQGRGGSRQKRGSQDAWRKKMIELSCEYSLICGETSFVAVEERAAGEKAKGTAELRRVPVQITTGWHGGHAFQSLGGKIPGGALLSRLVQPASVFMQTANTLCDSMRSVCEDESEFPSVRKARRSSSPVITPKTERNDDIISINILVLQQAEGWFPLEDALARLAGRSTGELNAWAKELQVPAGVDVAKALATVLAIHLLRTKAAGEEDLWGIGVRKAEALLSDRKITGPADADVFTWVARKLAS